MAANTTVLIIVAALAVLALATMVVVAVRKTPTRQRYSDGTVMTGTHTAIVEIETEPAQADSPQQHATSYRSEAVTSRDQLNEGRINRLAG